ncbi:MAG: hypothetical protein WA840_23885 [Caulobacteraceae bacterium]
MAYNIFAQNLLGAIALERDSVPGALKKARELRQDGMWNVRIADEQGHWLDESQIVVPPAEPQSLH